MNNIDNNLSFLEKLANQEVYQQMRDLLFGGRMVAFVGAGCSVPLGYPTWTGLIRKMLEKCIVRDQLRESRWRRLINALTEKAGEQLLTLADECKKTLDIDYFELLEEEFAPKPEKKHTREHEYLFKLPFHRFITSNYDPCLDYALSAIRDDLNKSFDYKDDRMARFAIHGDETRNLIFHCHGRHRPSQEIILTESDYQEHYEKRPDYTQILRALFLSSNVLFVGFSLSDADFGQIPRQLAALFDHRGPKHFAVLPMPEGDDEFTRREELRSRYNIRAIFYTVAKTQDGKPDHSARARVLEKLQIEWEERNQTTSQMSAPTPEIEPIESPTGFEPLEDSLKHFRNPRLLEAKDFEQGQVFMDETKRQTVWNYLGDPDKRCCLVYGESGSGKTVFAFALGYWLKAYKHISESFYLDLDRARDSSEIFFRRLSESIISHDQPDLLFIIDNCHLEPNLTDELVQVAQEQTERARFLFISRPTSRRAFAEEAKYFELLDDRSLKLIADKLTFKNIIQNFAGDESNSTNVKTVMQTCKSNLYLLSLLIEEWNPLTKALHELGRDVIYRKIYRESKAQIQSGALTKLSAIYQFEVPISFQIIQKWGILPDVNALIDSDTVEEGLLKGGGLHYFLPHPAYAEVVLETAEHHGLIPDRNAYEREICEQYIRSKPLYLNYFLRGLHNNGRKDLLRHFLETNPEQFAEEMRVGESSVQTIYWFLRDWITEDEAGSKTFVEELGQQFWATAFETSNLMDKDHLLRIFLKLGQNKLATSLVAAWSSKQIIKEVEATGLTKFDFLLVTLSSIDRSLCNMLLDKITPVKLADILKSKLATITTLHQIFRMCSPDFRKPFLQAFNQSELLTIFNNSGLGQIGTFIQYYNQYPLIRKAYQTFEREHLHTALEDASLEEISKFIRRITFPKEAFPPHFPQMQYAPNAIQKLKSVDIASKVKAASLHATAYFLWNVFVVDRVQAERYNMAVRMLGLRDKFSQSELHEINFFLWNLYETNTELPDTFRDKELRRVIADKAQDAKLEKILETIGIFEFVGCPILRVEIAEPELSRATLEQYFWEMITNKSSPFTLMRTLKGLEMVDADWARQFFDDDGNLTSSLIDFLVSNIEPKMTEKTERLHAECLAFLRSIDANE